MSKEEVKEKQIKLVEVEPIRDFKCQFDKKYDIKKGKKISVPQALVASLKTEKVIK